MRGRLIFWFIILAFAVSAVMLFRKCSKDSFSDESLLIFLPENSAVALIVEEPVETWETLRAHSLWNILMQNQYLSNLSSELNELDSLLHKNKLLFNLLGKREVLWSWQKSEKGYRYLTAINLKESESNPANAKAVSALYGMGAEKRVRNFGSYGITEFTDSNGKYYMCFTERALLLSDSYKIMTNSLRAASRENRKTYELLSDLEQSNLTILVKNPEFGQYVKDYSGNNQLIESDEWKSVDYACWSLFMDDPIMAAGLLKFNPEAKGRLGIMKAKDKSGEVPLLLSAHSLSASLYFSDLLSLATDILSSGGVEEEQQLQELYTLIERAENYLDFSLTEDFLAELSGSAQYLRFSGEDNKDHQILLLGLEDEEKIESNLGELLKKVKARTPLIPKRINFDGNRIEYFVFNRLFNSLFSDLTGGIQLPYYTIRDDKMLLSESVRGLQEYLRSERIEADIYGDFLRKKETNIDLSIALRPFFHSIKRTNDENGLFNKGAWALYAMEHFILDVSRESDSTYSMGMLLSFEGDYTFQKYLKERSKYLLKQKSGEQLASVEKDFTWLPEDPEKRTEEEFYSNGSLMYSIRIKRGVYHGLYKEFYEDKTLKTKGFFREGKKTGTWKYYDSNGNLLKKERL